MQVDSAKFAKFRIALRDVAMIALGFLLVLVGIAGLFLPIVPGIPIFLAGIFILASRCAWAFAFMQILRRRFPLLNRIAPVSSLGV